MARTSRSTLLLLLLLLLLLALAAPAGADWPLWRGPAQNGASPETGLVSSWSPDGENLIWKAEFIGRSTPVVVHGQVCVIGRTGTGVDKQEVVACFDAGTGKKRWEHRHNVYHTTVAFNRVGWASLAGDVETGNIYAHGTAGQLIAFDKDGKVLWERFLEEEFGRASGYGGRTQTPIVWGDQLLLTSVNVGWGEQAAPRHRYFSFDKRSGELQWVSTPGVMVHDMNTQSGPVVAEIGGRHLLVAGNADGHVYAVDLATGDPVWDFPLSANGLNATVVVAGDTVFASHSEENLDEATQGRLVAFRGTGSGNIAGQELWRDDLMSDGFPTPAYHAGKLYVVDNSANLMRLDAATGKVEWEYGLGTVGKASPVVADGKIYVPELNGRFHILGDGKDGPTPLDLDELTRDGEHYAEIYGSAAIAYGRIYLSTEGWLYAIGDPAKPFRVSPPGAKGTLPAGSGDPARLLVTPAEVVLRPGATAAFTAHAFDAKGLPLGTVKAEWSVDGLGGTIDGSGRFRAAPGGDGRSGAVLAKSGSLTGTARLRVIPDLPWSLDFESQAVGSVPAHWIGARGKFEVEEQDGGKVLAQPVRERGLQRSRTYFGGDFSDYTIEADVLGGVDKRRSPDIGLINAGYQMDLMGEHQRLEIRSWAADRRIARNVDLPWEMGVWYRMKLRVHVEGGSAQLAGKVWKRGTPEPQAWNLEFTDPVPVTHGSPGLIGYAPVPIHYDNIQVHANR